MAPDPAPLGPAAPAVATVTRPLTWPSLLQLSPDDRPRERLRRHGAEILTSAELLAVVLGTGAGAEDALQLARRALDTLGGVEALATATADDLIAVPGIGPGKAARIIAAFALAWRSVRVAAELDREAGLAALAPPETTIPDALRRVRGQVAGSERAVIGFHPRDAVPPITLALGETLGPRSRLGSYLARLLAEGTGPWWIIVVRPGRPARDIERQRAVDLLEAAHLVGVDLEHVLLLVGFEHSVLASTDPTLDPRSVPLTITDPDDARPANTDDDPRAVTPATPDEEAAS
ncbi:MAG: hypothetical protein H6701_04585 [Myxococcales bacterium]|nr:hypothetical protein [Myxococcales bacterium]